MGINWRKAPGDPWPENVTCPLCRFRHPATFTCEEARHHVARSREISRAAEAPPAPSPVTAEQLAGALRQMLRARDAVSHAREREQMAEVYADGLVTRFFNEMENGT